MALLILVAPNAAGGADDTPAEIVRLGFLSYQFPGVSLKDAQVATNYWMGQFLRKIGKNYEPRAIIYHDLEAAVRDLQSSRLEMINLATWDYLRIRDRVPLTPALVSTYDRGRTHKRCLLMTRSDAGWGGIRRLEGSALVVQEMGGIPEMWIDLYLLEKGLPTARAHFGKVESVAKPSRAVLPVYFGQADACVVGEDAFTTLAELNPQLTEELEVLAKSPGYLMGLLCFTQACGTEIREAVSEAALRIDTEEEGRQTLTLFRASGVSKYHPSFLTNIEYLLRRHSELTITPGGKR